MAGRIGLYSFASGDALTAEGADRYAAAAGAQPAPGTGTIHEGALESSNQDVISGSLQLVLMQRQAEMMQKAVSIFSNDFDKTASEDLPRV
jgi:flagellar basal-body rod protein FlgF/flagellar basal-body rod protein FlgG